MYCCLDFLCVIIATDLLLIYLQLVNLIQRDLIIRI